MRNYRRLKDKKAAAEYIIANRETKTLTQMGEELNISRERVRQLAIDLGVEKPKKGLAWYRAEVKRLREQVANLSKMQHMTVA